VQFVALFLSSLLKMHGPKNKMICVFSGDQVGY